MLWHALFPDICYSFPVGRQGEILFQTSPTLPAFAFFPSQNPDPAIKVAKSVGRGDLGGPGPGREVLGLARVRCVVALSGR